MRCGSCRSSAASVLLAIATSGMAQVTLGIKANDIVYDKVRDVIYASVAADSPLHAKRIIAINPNTASVIDFLDVPLEPTVLAISDSCQSLLAVLHESGEVLRLNPNTLTQVGSFVIGEFFGETHTLYDIDFSPGSDTRIAVMQASAENPFSNDRNVIFENWLPLPNFIANLDLFLTFSGSPNLLYGQGNSELYWLPTNSSGFISAQGQRSVVGGHGRFLDWYDNHVFTANGRVVDPQQWELKGTFPTTVSGEPFVLDPANGIAVFGRDSGSTPFVEFYDLATYRLLEAIQLPLVEDFVKIVRWGTCGVAIATEGPEIRLLRTPYVWSAKTIVPATLSVVRGRVTDGDLESLQASDDRRLNIRPGATFTTAQAPIEIVLSSNLASPTSSGIAFTIEGRATSNSIQQQVEFYNFVTSSYESIDVRPCGPLENRITLEVHTNPNRFIDSATSEVRARIKYRATGPVISYPWSATLDHVYWNSGAIQ